MNRPLLKKKSLTSTLPRRQEELKTAEEYYKNNDIEKARNLLKFCFDSLKASLLNNYKISKDSADYCPNFKPKDDIKPEMKEEKEQKRREIEREYRGLRSTILYEIGDFEDAEKGFKTLLDEGPVDEKQWYYQSYADCLRKRHAYEEALDYYNKGYEIGKEYSKHKLPSLLNNRGLTYIALQQYENALKDFEEAVKLESGQRKCLYICNQGQAYYLLGERKAALECFQTSDQLIQAKPDPADDGDFNTHLRMDQANYIKKRFQEFLKELDQLEEIQLKISDEVMVAREKKYVVDVIKGCNAKEVEEKEKEKEWENFTQILDSKKKLELIQDNPILYHFYDGFLYTLSQGYTVATVVNSEKLSVDTSNKAVSAVSTLISLIPMIGSQVSEGINKVWDFVKDAQVKKAAVNVCSFATTVTEFESMAQEVTIDIIFRKKTELESIDPQTYLLPSWTEKFKQLISKFNANIYGERNQTPMQKLGYQTASCLISQYIASGQIYDNQPPVCVLPKQRKIKLLGVSLVLLNETIDERNKEYVKKETIRDVQPASPEPNRRSHCCAMF